MIKSREKGVLGKKGHDDDRRRGNEKMKNGVEVENFYLLIFVF